jgi:splicing factor 3B subunit 3
MIDLTTYILGESAVKLIKMFVLGKPAILALSERPWLIYAYGNKQIINPLSFPHLDIAAYARTPNNPHTICGLYEKSLVFLSLENFGQMFNSELIPLTYSGKKLIVADSNLIILES